MLLDLRCRNCILFAYDLFRSSSTRQNASIGTSHIAPVFGRQTGSDAESAGWRSLFAGHIAAHLAAGGLVDQLIGLLAVLAHRVEGHTHEATALVQQLLHLLEAATGAGGQVSAVVLEGLGAQTLLQRRERILHRLHQLLGGGRRSRLLLLGVARHQHHLLSLQIPWTDLDAKRHTAQLPVEELIARALGAVVDHHPHACCTQYGRVLVCLVHRRAIRPLLHHRQQQHLVLSDARRVHQTTVITVGTQTGRQQTR
mmetsp:Transcript_3928/g.9594  ORF Transcript_3928/g.9594 Transcript_3928/m.9594 type:complete len:255 (-) Transcript_3928:919-1683(-)